MLSQPLPMVRRRLLVYLMLFVMCTINYSDRAVLSVGIGAIADEFHLGPVSKGWVLSGYLWTYVLFLVPMAMGVDRWGTRLAASLAVAFWSAATMLNGAVWSLPSLFGSRLLLGLGEAPCFPIGHRTIREWAPAPERGLAASVFTSGILAGVSFGALASGWLITLVGWRTCFLIFGAAGFAWVAAWLCFFDKPERVGWLDAGEREHILATRDLAPKGAGRTTVGDLLRQPAMWGLIITQICGNYTNVFFLTWLPSYLSAARHVSIIGSGAQTALCYGCACAGTVLVGVLSDRVLVRSRAAVGGRRYLVAILLLGASVMAYAPFTDSHMLLLVLLTVALTCMQSSLANNQALLSDLLPDGQAIGTAIGVLFMFANFFAIGAPIATGYIVERTGSYINAFAFAAMLTSIGAASVLFLCRRPISLERGEPVRLAVGGA